jgi:glutamate dehydrogenase/leucine dehydrogenase
MGVLDDMASGRYEQVVFGHDRDTGLRAIIAIHDTTLGPSLGGVRMRPYPTEEEALTDVLRLARAMTYKFAAAGIDLGGGKSVIVGDPTTDKDEALLRAYGRLVATLGGRYIPGIDMGTTQDDLRTIGREADPVSCTGVDPSPYTALGVFATIRACVRHVDGTDDLDGVRVAVQGVGHVGEPLARDLAESGAELVLSDVDTDRAGQLAAALGAETAPPDEILATPCDVLAPCAIGGVVDEVSLPLLKCRVVAGGANNILADPGHADDLRRAGIIYAPDYVANAGGVILLDVERAGQPPERARERCLTLGDRILEILRRADEDGITTVEAADRLAEARLEEARR